MAFFFLILAGCSSHPIIIPASKNPINHLKTPTLILPADADHDMVEAARVFGEYANSDEFYTYVRENVDELDGGNETNVNAAIARYRQCLNQSSPIRIEWRQYSNKNRGKVIGGWRDTYLAQNPYKKLDIIERAGHWIHEIGHACGFTHTENDINAYPIIKKSWPYQVGRTFKEFLQTKTQ